MSDEKASQEQRAMDVEDINGYLSGLEPGFSVVIHRLEPQWCKGLLDEIAITESSQPIDLKWLIRTWGGHKLRLKFRDNGGKWLAHRDIALYSFPPLLYGQKIQQERNPHILGEDEPASPPPRAIISAPPLEPPRDDRKSLLELMALMQQMRSADLQAMSQMMSAQQSNQPAPADPMRMMQGAIALLGQFQQMRMPAAADDGKENDEVIGLLGKIADVFASRSNAPPPARITPGESRPMTEQLSIVGGDIMGALAGMEPTEAISTLQGAVGKMSPDKQAQTMAALIGSIENIGGTDLLLDSLEQRGIIGDDGFSDDDETSDTPDPPDNENTGRKSQSNEGNYPPDR